MRRFAFVLLLAFLTIGTTGCSWFYGSVNKDFAEASKGYADVVFPEYEAYIDADPNLNSEDKDIRKGTPAKWRKLIADALAKEE